MFNTLKCFLQDDNNFGLLVLVGYPVVGFAMLFIGWYIAKG